MLRWTTFPALEGLGQSIFKILPIRTVALADRHRNMSRLLLLSFLGPFSKFHLSKFVGTFPSSKSRLLSFEGIKTSGRRNRAPPLFCFSNVLCLSSSAEFNLKAAEDWAHEGEENNYLMRDRLKKSEDWVSFKLLKPGFNLMNLEGKIFKGGEDRRTGEIVTCFLSHQAL